MNDNRPNLYKHTHINKKTGKRKISFRFLIISDLWQLSAKVVEM